MHLADKAEFSQYIECTIDSHQPDFGMFTMNLPMYGSRGKMVMACCDCLYNSPPLRRDLVTMLPQYRCYFILGESHLNC